MGAREGEGAEELQARQGLRHRRAPGAPQLHQAASPAAVRKRQQQQQQQMKEQQQQEEQQEQEQEQEQEQGGGGGIIFAAVTPSPNPPHCLLSAIDREGREASARAHPRSR